MRFKVDIESFVAKAKARSSYDSQPAPSFVRQYAKPAVSEQRPSIGKDYSKSLCLKPHNDGTSSGGMYDSDVPYNPDNVLFDSNYREAA